MYHIEGVAECNFDNIEKVVLGSGKIYYVYDDEDPVVSVEININSFFSDAIIFNDYMVIGNYCEGIYLISLIDHSVRNIKIRGYFAYFEIDKDVLYVLGCNNVIAFNSDLELKWESDNLAEDGVVCDSIEDDIMTISCEMNPPGGWIERKLSLVEGKIIDE
ncbi:hypothetical protein D6853_05475 [Butyrivibrio sp. X503]|nr:hypothetical protein D6853_05475 [Butyrivibrio sp. X503]